jgi:hypothetical protein
MGTRATYPVSHLGRGRPVEVAPQCRVATGSAAQLAAQWSARREGEMACGGARWGGEQPTSIYRRGEAVEGPEFEHEELVRPSMAVRRKKSHSWLGRRGLGRKLWRGSDCDVADKTPGETTSGDAAGRWPAATMALRLGSVLMVVRRRGVVSSVGRRGVDWTVRAWKRGQGSVPRRARRGCPGAVGVGRWPKEEERKERKEKKRRERRKEKEKGK